MQPTDEQIKEFWEWCGFSRRLPEGRAGYHWEQCVKVMNWMSPDYKEIYKSMSFLPPIDLNNLFKWAVPKVIASGHWLGMITIQMSIGTQYTFAIYVEKYKDKAEHEGRDKDPALALFWAIWEVIKEV